MEQQQQLGQRRGRGGEEEESGRVGLNRMVVVMVARSRLDAAQMVRWGAAVW